VGHGTKTNDMNGNFYQDFYCYDNAYVNAADTGSLVYDLYRQYDEFTGTVYLGDYAKPGQSAIFRVYGDGNLLYTFDTAVLTESQSFECFTVDNGVLTYVADNEHPTAYVVLK